MFAEGAGFSAFGLKVLITSLIIILSCTWAVFNLRGHFKLFSNGDISGGDLLIATLKVIGIILILTIFLILNY